MRNKSKEDWFVLCTKARQELKVLQYLNQIGIEAYTPTKIEVRSWSDRKKKVQNCLLSSMVLVRLHEKEVNKVFVVPGVKRYLFVHGARAIVYDHEVIAMKNYLETKFKIDKQIKNEIGKTVEVPLLRQKGEIIGVKGQKCIIRLQMLGATMSYQLN